MTKICLTATLLAILSLPGAPAAAQSVADGPGLVREGNTLARDRLYHAALLRYREAAAAGVDSPLLHYNLGVVYYRLERHDEAAAEFRVARGDSALAAVATYNLALVELARGDQPAAMAAFRSVVDMGASRPLRRAARDGLALLENSPSGPASAEPAAADARSAPADDSPGGLRFSARASYAQDSNVYRTPSAAYVDLSDPAAPVTVDPVVYSAGYTPVDLLAAYVLPNEAEDTEFVFGYLLNGDFYDSEFSNANRLSQELSIGADIDMKAKEGRWRRLDSAFYVRTHAETNFDPDDGLARTLTDTDLDDRLSWRGAGMRADYLHERGRFLFGFEIDLQRRHYEDAGLLPNYDHDSYDSRGFVDIEFGARSEVGIGISRLRRIYDERRARDLTGALTVTEDFVYYDYRGADLTYRRLVGQNLVVEAGIGRLEREDRYLHYNDYEQDIASAGLTYRPGTRLRVSARLSAHRYDFPNAFAYNNVLGGQRELEVSRADIEVEYALTDRLALTLTAMMDESTATDAREQYDQSVASLGIRWRRD